LELPAISYDPRRVPAVRDMRRGRGPPPSHGESG
jgi:hypothetical protein